jgi:hypothetical protein
LEDVLLALALAADCDFFTLNCGTIFSNQVQMYQAMLGSIMYVVVWTHLDLLECCSKLGAFAHNPLDFHKVALHCLFYYLRSNC